MLGDLAIAAAGAANGAVAVATLRRLAPDLVHRRRPWSVVVVALAAAAWAATGAAAPTGTDGVDLVLRAGFAAVLTLAASRARRHPLVVAAGLAGLGAAGGVALAAAFAALGSLAVAATFHRRSRFVSSLAGALVANALLRLGWPEESLATAAIAAGAAALVLVSALVRLPRPTRRRCLAASGALVVVVLGIVAVTGLSVLGQRDRLRQAEVAVDRGLAAARQGDIDTAVEELDAAGAVLAAVDDDLGSWWLRPAAAVPVLAQHLGAAEETVLAVRDVATAAREATRAADVRALRTDDGAVDLVALEAAREPVIRTEAAARRVRRVTAGIRSPWLLPTVEELLDDLERRVIEAAADAASIRDALSVLPGVLGADGPQRWLVLVATPSELRGGGGFVGSWGLLTATDGRLELPVVERTRALSGEAPFDVSVDPEFDARYLDRWGLHQYFQNVTASPHLPSTARAAVQIVESLGLGEIHGVMVVDPLAVAGLLEITGPVTVPWWPEPITAVNGAEVLLHEQYEQASDPDRIDFLEEVMRVVFRRLVSGSLPSPGRLASVLGPLAEQGHIQLHAFDDDVDGWIERIGAGSDLVRPVVDGMGVVHHDWTPTKANYFLRRAITHEVEVDPETGAAETTTRVELTNLAGDVPDNGYFGRPEPEGAGLGTMQLAESFYSVLPLASIHLDGEPTGTAQTSERGYLVHESFLELEPGETVVVEYRHAGTLPVQDGWYRLDVHRQPIVAPDELTVVINGETVHDGPQDRDLVFEVDLSPDGSSR